MEILLAHVHISGRLSVVGIALLLLMLCGIAILVKAIFCNGTRILGFIVGIALLGLLFFGSLFASYEASRSSHVIRAEHELRAVEAQHVEQLARQAEKLDSKGVNYEINYEEALDQLNRPRIRIVEGSDESANQPAATAELKVATDSTRPAWVDKVRTRVGNVQRRVVKVGPWESVMECRRVLGETAMKATYAYMREEFMRENGGGEELSLEAIRKIGIDKAFVLHEICTDEFVETTEHDFGGENREMHTLHVLMEFSPSVHKALEHRLLDYQRQQKATMVSLVAGGVFGVLGLIYGLLKVDTWTKGYYAKRLWIGVPAAVISLLATIALFVV